MFTVQLAIENTRYAAALADLLKKDGSHLVTVADRPDLNIDSIIVMDGRKPENLMLFEAEPDRFVVIARKDAAVLSRIWDAGVRHVVFEEDSPTTAVLAVIAAELRSPHLRDSRSLAPALLGAERRHLQPEFPVPILDWRQSPCRCSSIRAKKPLFR